MNRAADIGPNTFAWWKDWRGQCVAIIASGPSVKKARLELLRNRIHVLAIKENVNLCPWADVVYGCDWPWWHHRQGLPEYTGLKLAYAHDAYARYADVHQIVIESAHSNELLTDVPGSIGAGGNSGFQALNIAVQFGATGIMLIGFDAHDRSGAHWYGRNFWHGANNPDELNFQRWLEAMQNIMPKLEELGVDVVNVSEISRIECFRRASLEQALEQWGL